ncbi:glycosyltransferase [Gelidibacter gilvus]|uniref:Glycosyltransferase n=1 Tax=Gelidibacter gilvus TaxID=59602 RepID=A0A4Q0XH15_9FLAO|nr:glycosyltransferase [Gelidibacter gilvus]RXJ46056.1 glycosyltransferase [Gelidibacter gilvus]
MSKIKTRLWIFIDWYLPAYKAGGPIQSVSNLVGRLKKEFDISIVTSNSDLGEPLALETKDINVWMPKDGYRVMYVDEEHQNKQFYEELFSNNTFDVVYFNSLFSIKYTLLPFWLLRNQPIRRVLASRGMLGKGALAIKPLKKNLFLKLFKVLGLHNKVVWHATAQTEVDEIKDHFGPEIKIMLAPNLSSIGAYGFIEKEKQIHQLNIFFLSRIAIKKNLLGALDTLSNIKINSKIRFNIIGPIDDKVYWQKCGKWIKSLPENINVNYLGAIPNSELPLILKEEHILFLPTYGENFGHVIMESWQNGCPVIISDQTPWLDLESNKLGFDISLERNKKFIEAIEQFCDMSEAEYNVWSASAFNYAKKFVENPEVLEQNKALFLNA